jgi:hypothetical protein
MTAVMSEEEDEGDRFAVPGKESHEHEDALSPDEKGEEGQDVPPPSEPKDPTPHPAER